MASSKLPRFLLQQEQKQGFEALVKRDAQELVARGSAARWMAQGKSLLTTLLYPNAIAGVVGYVLGGPEGAVETMKEFSTTVLPVVGGLKVLADAAFRPYFINTMDQAIEYHATLKKNLLSHMESSAAQPISLVANTLVGAGILAGISKGTELITPLEANQMHMALAGAGLVAANWWYQKQAGTKLQDEIREWVDTELPLLEQPPETPITMQALEDITRYGIAHRTETNLINAASSPKSFRGAPGAAGFLGALDSLTDDIRDPTRKRPEVNVRMTTDVGSRVHKDRLPEFTFRYERPDTLTDAVLRLAQVVHAQSREAEITITPHFHKARLEHIRDRPYEALFSLQIVGRTDAGKVFEVQYTDEVFDDKVQVTVHDRNYLHLLPEMYRTFRGQPLTVNDFDVELLALATSQKSSTPHPALQERLELDDLETKRILSDVDDPLDTLRPVGRTYDKDGLADVVEEQPKTVEIPPFHIKPKKTAARIGQLYRQFINRLTRQKASYGLDIHVPGVMYTLQPQGGNADRETIGAYAIKHPIRAMQGLIGERSIMPELRSVGARAQIPGISQETIEEVLERLDSAIPGLQMEVQIKDLDYAAFWDINSDPSKIFSYARRAEIETRDGTHASLFFREPKRTTQQVVNETFPFGDQLETLAQEARQARVDRDYERMKELLAYGTSRYEDELEKPTYQVVTSDGDNPKEVVVFDNSRGRQYDGQPTVWVESQKVSLFHTPSTHFKDGIKRVTALLEQISKAAQPTDVYNG